MFYDTILDLFMLCEIHYLSLSLSLCKNSFSLSSSTTFAMNITRYFYVSSLYFLRICPKKLSVVGPHLPLMVFLCRSGEILLSLVTLSFPGDSQHSSIET